MLSKLKRKNSLIIAGIAGLVFYYEYYRFVCLRCCKAYRQLRHYETLINQICDQIGYPYKAIVAGIIMTESSGRVDAIGSSHNERGLMQIWEPTFNSLNSMFNFNFSYNELYSPQLNIYVGVTLLNYLKNKGLSIRNQIKAYNVGEDLEPKDKADIYLKKVLNWI